MISISSSSSSNNNISSGLGIEQPKQHKDEERNSSIEIEAPHDHDKDQSVPAINPVDNAMKNREICLDEAKRRNHYMFSIDGVEVYFPFKPYPVQEEYMRSVVLALNNRQNALLQSPTGTGKTLSLLCAALGWLRHRRQSPNPDSFNRILFCSRTHSQLKQIVKELKSTAYKAKVCILASRDQYCLKKEFLNLKDLELNGACKKSVLDKSCQFYNFKGTEKRQVHRIFDEVLDIEDLQIKAANASSSSCGKFCPYYYSREIKDEADVVILPYSFLLQQNRFVNFQVILQDSIIIFDEAHNVPSTAEEGTSYRVDQNLISESYKELEYLSTHLTPAMRSKPNDIKDAQQLVTAFGNLLRYFERSTTLEKQKDGSIGKLSRMPYFFEMIEQISDQLFVSRKQSHKQSLASKLMAEADSDGKKKFDYQTMLKDIKGSKNKKQDAKTGQTTLFNFQFKKTITQNSVQVDVSNQSTLKDQFQFQERTTKLGPDDLFAAVLEDSDPASTKPPNGSIDRINKVWRKMAHIITDMQTLKCQNIDFFAGFISGICSMHQQDVAFSRGAVKCKISDFYRFYFHKVTGNTNEKSSINLWCLDPSLAFQNIAKQRPHSIILTSGTLDPMNSWDTELNIPFAVKLSTTHVIDPSQSVIASVVKQGPSGAQLNFSYNNRQNGNSVYEELGNFVIDVSKRVPNGILVCFCSKSVMKFTQDAWTSSTNRIIHKLNEIKELFFEPNNNIELAQVMKAYQLRATDDSKGAILFCVCRGKISEGIDFTDKLARAVILVGVPFPPSADTWVCTKMEYLDSLSAVRSQEGINKTNVLTLTGKEWYFLNTVRAMNQALGRVIRHKDDFGSLFLCDTRFGQQQFSDHISVWVKNVLKTYESHELLMTSVDKFFQDKKDTITTLDKLLILGQKAQNICSQEQLKSAPTQSWQKTVVKNSEKRFLEASYSTRFAVPTSQKHSFTEIFTENKKIADSSTKLNQQTIVDTNTGGQSLNSDNKYLPSGFNWNGLYQGQHQHQHQQNTPNGNLQNYNQFSKDYSQKDKPALNLFQEPRDYLNELTRNDNLETDQHHSQQQQQQQHQQLNDYFSSDKMSPRDSSILEKRAKVNYSRSGNQNNWQKNRKFEKKVYQSSSFNDENSDQFLGEIFREHNNLPISEEKQTIVEPTMMKSSSKPLKPSLIKDKNHPAAPHSSFRDYLNNLNNETQPSGSQSNTKSSKTFDKAMLCNTAKGLGSFNAGDIVQIKIKTEENPSVQQDEKKQNDGEEQNESIQAQLDDAVLCPICYEPPKNNHMNINCHHKACYACWQKWLSQQLTCPMCRIRCRMAYLEPCP